MDATSHGPDPDASDSHGDAARALSLLADGNLAGHLIEAHVASLAASPPASPPADVPESASASAAQLLAVGLAALDAFLQANVTGPVLPADRIASVEKRFAGAWTASHRHGPDREALNHLRRACLANLDVDGISPYAHIPYLELFSLARYVFVDALAGEGQRLLGAASPYSPTTCRCSVAWMRLRVHVWHYKLLTHPSLGRGSNFTKSAQWSDVPTLASTILELTESLLGQISGDEVWSTAETWSREDRAHFLVEAANNYILLGHHARAKRSLKHAAQASGLAYALSGALGKRTRFQEKSTSQLVVLARSGDNQHAPSQHAPDVKGNARSDTLQLNDDTLLEDIHFIKDGGGPEPKSDDLPPRLADLSPDNQPQLPPLDQIILLTEATLKDAFSPVDALTSEEVLSFAVRVLADKSTNWQIYTQALLVRSRIELHRSRTVERGVLQLQAVADQVLADTLGVPKQPGEPATDRPKAGHLPAIQVLAPGQDSAATSNQSPTSFLPAPRVSESAPAHIRLRYIHALSTPPRWHLESELAYAWAGVGSLTSALEIFKRLRLWAEVALCLASAAASDDEDGRGSGGEAKAKAIIRWRLFHRTGDDGSSGAGPDDEGVQDVTLLKVGDFEGPERSPPPPNAARLWCILGDLENDPSHYERAWEISKHRYARAQKSLGEHYLRQRDWRKAQAAYKMATAVNRLSPDMWGRLGDISLRLGRFEEAAESYSRSIGSSTDTAGGEDAKTWSNLGSALWSLYCEVVAETGGGGGKDSSGPGNADDGEGEGGADAPAETSRDPSVLLARSLAAYKKGASIAHDNWRIWDNVLTLASRMRPAPVPDMVLALRHIVRIRRSEEAVDVDVLSALLQDVVLAKDNLAKDKDAGSGAYEPPRGSAERLVTRLVDDDVVPLITRRSELWALVSRLRAWRRDFAGAVDASERAWRAAVGPSGGPGPGLLPGAAAGGDSAPAPADWTTDESAWAGVVKRTDELVSALENWGPRAESVGARWRAKARSAVRSVMGRARESWEAGDGWRTLEGLMEGLRGDK